MKTYNSKSNARRAAKSEHGVDFEAKVNFVEVDGKWGYENKPADQVKKTTAVLKGVPLRRKSTLEGPCKEVWEIADEMEGATRKEVIAECVKRGIAFFTARTQYQSWKSACVESARNAAKANAKG